MRHFVAHFSYIGLLYCSLYFRVAFNVQSYMIRYRGLLPRFMCKTSCLMLVMNVGVFLTLYAFNLHITKNKINEIITSSVGVATFPDLVVYVGIEAEEKWWSLLLAVPHQFNELL